MGRLQRAPVWLLGMTAGAALVACAGLLGYDRAELDDGDALVESGTRLPDGGDGSDAANDSATRGDAAAYGEVVLSDGPRSYWRLDDPAGSVTAKDERGFKAADVTGPVAFVEAGIINGAAMFNGDSLLSIGDNYDFTGTMVYSVEFWAQPTPSQEFNNVAVKHLSDDTTGFALYFRHDPSLPKPDIIQMEEHWPGTVKGRSCSAVVGPGARVHIVLTYSMQHGPRFYVNGVFESGASGCFDDNTGGPPDSNKSFEWAQGYKGVLDELAIYSTELTAERIKAHYDAATSP